jgi:hypothetical protein
VGTASLGLGRTPCHVHSLIAFSVRYNWDHDAAVRATATQAAEIYGVAWRGSLYVNYVFLALWLLAAWPWRHWGWRVFVLTMVVNSASCSHGLRRDPSASFSLRCFSGPGGRAADPPTGFTPTSCPERTETAPQRRKRLCRCGGPITSTCPGIRVAARHISRMKSGGGDVPPAIVEGPATHHTNDLIPAPSGRRGVAPCRRAAPPARA